MTTADTTPRPITKGIILVYVFAMIAANVTIAELGPAAVIPVGFLLIGLNLVARDRLHDRLAEHGRPQLIGGLAALISFAGAASWVANPAAGPIALASLVAFLAAATVDALAYGWLRGRTTPARASAGSNVPASVVDSFTFLALAFPGPVPVVLALAQALAKIAGGAVWAWALYVLPGQLDRAAAAQLAELDEREQLEREEAADAATLDEAIRRDLGSR